MVIAIHTKPIEFSFICSLGLIILLYHVTLYIFLDKNCNIHFINFRDDYLKHGRVLKKYLLTMLMHINLIILLIFFSICLIEGLEPLMLLKISPEIIATKAVAFYHKTMFLNKSYQE
jgi:hypothetical protein